MLESEASSFESMHPNSNRVALCCFHIHLLLNAFSDHDLALDIITLSALSLRVKRYYLKSFCGGAQAMQEPMICDVLQHNCNSQCRM